MYAGGWSAWSSSSSRSRSRSTTDVYRATRPEQSGRRAATEAPSGCSTLQRAALAAARPSRAPTPPPRSNSRPPGRARLLPRDDSFVQKLVAALERRRRCSEQTLQPGRPAALRLPVPPEAASRRSQPGHRPPTLVPEYACCSPTAAGPAAQLPAEEPREDELEDDNYSSRGSSSRSINSSSSRSSSRSSSSASSYVSCKEVVAGGSASASIKSSARRALKKLGSLLAWRSQPKAGLPRGKRLAAAPATADDVYATRESLSEEMRTFRRDNLPRLIGRLHTSSSSSCSYELEQRRQFSRMISGPRLRDEQLRASTATIRPRYGKQQQQQPQQQQQQPTIYATSIKVRAPPPPPPPPPSQLQPLFGSPARARDEQLLRPSRVREEELLLRARRPFLYDNYRGGSGSSSSSNNNGHNDKLVVYDVPLSNRPVRACSPPAELPRRPVYQNSEWPFDNEDDYEDDDDERLQRTVFTTF